MLRRLGRRPATVIASALVVGALSAGCFGATADVPRTAYPMDSSGLVAMVNQTRADHGLAPLAWDSQLGTLAGDWSGTMAARGNLAHRDLQSTIERPEFSRFARLDENVLVGWCSHNLAEIHRAWMNSASHAANILAREADVIGIGVVCGADGRLWATQNFGRLR